MTPEELKAEARELRLAWKSACWAMAYTNAWPKVDLGEMRDGFIGGGEANWRAYLALAPTLEMQRVVAPALKELMDAIPKP